MCQGENSCCIQSWLVHQGPSCQATIQRCMGPSWQTAANEAEVVGRVRVLQKRAMQPLFSCLTHLKLNLQAPITLVLISTCNLIYFLPILRVYQQSRLTQPHLLHHLPKHPVTNIYTEKNRSIILICSHKVSECKISIFLFWKWRCKDTDGIHANMTTTVLIAAHESRSGHTYRSCTANVPSNLFGHTGNSMGNKSCSHIFSIYFQKPQFVTVKHWANGVCTFFLDTLVHVRPNFSLCFFKLEVL